MRLALQLKKWTSNGLRLASATAVLASFLWANGAGSASAATFGTPIVIGGQAADLALDEQRGVLYIANFTANRIEVMSLATGSIQTSMNVAPQPGSISISPDHRWLLVAHFGNFATPNQPRNALTLINLDNNQRQTFSLSAVPLSVAFGSDGNALVATSNAFLLFDPVTGATRTLLTMAELALKTLPQPFNNFPQNIVASSSQATKDFTRIYGVIQGSAADTEVIVYRFDVGQGLIVGGRVSEPALAPRTLSLNANGTNVLVGWALLDQNFTNIAQFPNASGVLNIGGHVIDSARGLIYAQMNETITSSSTGTSSSGPTIDQEKILQVLDADNLTVRERIKLPENLAGKAILSSDGNTMFANSDSGVMILPVGDLYKQRKVVPSVSDLVFQGNFCDRRVAVQTFVIGDSSGQSTDFAFANVPNGVTVSPLTGTTPATVTVSVDPLTFSNTRGTVVRSLDIVSDGSILRSAKLRLLINSKEPDQRGTSIHVPGTLVDIASDPTRDRFFIIQQDTNSVLVFDGTTYQQLATLRTGNTPTQLAFSFDKRYLLVGNDNSQVISVFALDTLRPQPSIQMPGGHYPRSIASAAGTTLVASRVAGPINMISRVDFVSRTATALPTLDTFTNDINVDTVLVASPNGAKIMGASKDGTTFLFDGNSNSFVTSRKDVTVLGGAYAASSFDQFVVGNFLLNGSLVPTKRLGPDTQTTYGFSFVDNLGFRLTSAGADGPGTIQRLVFPTATTQIGTRTVESPVLSNATTQPFIRTIAPLYSRNAIVLLTVSGFTVLPWSYDAAVATPRITKVTNLADGSTAIAPGSLVKIEGIDLSPINQASRERPLPTALGESCITVNGQPIPLIFVSGHEINAQIPYEAVGNTTLILRTPGGVSDNYNLNVASTAPSIFRTMLEGMEGQVATIVNGRNGLIVTNSNPVKRGDTIVIYLTGLGKTNPAVDSGLSAPVDPLARALVEPKISIGGVEQPVSYAGLTPGEVGVYQINAKILTWTPTGFTVPLTISQGGSVTTLNVRVIE
ncbi:hypothetical protein [Bryobacter aggregatus]|uniref:hypothetical protein n=1 Tax=Bryobacter aggregatus TaxID=360054 RepID=UPI00138E3313|nr:hypothetical protein [Bryobacter aggregatus]